MASTWWHRLRRQLGISDQRETGRVKGPPTSSNGASSLHARWVGEPSHVVAAHVDLTIDELPASSHLRFFAVQASFTDRGRPQGAGHLGLQWIDRHPGNTAVNWGGYHDQRSGRRGELPGSGSSLPSAAGNVNTRDYSWRAGATYRCTISRGADGWAGSVTDVQTGVVTVVRELHCPGDHLTSVVMWSEIFAPCEGPGVTVRWARPTWETEDGELVPVRRVELSYQRHADGGCANTSTVVEGDQVVQRTATTRVHDHGSMLALDLT